MMKLITLALLMVTGGTLFALEPEYDPARDAAMDKAASFRQMVKGKGDRLTGVLVEINQASLKMDADGRRVDVRLTPKTILSERLKAGAAVDVEVNPKSFHFEALKVSKR